VYYQTIERTPQAKGLGFETNNHTQGTSNDTRFLRGNPMREKPRGGEEIHYNLIFTRVTRIQYGTSLCGNGLWRLESIGLRSAFFSSFLLCFLFLLSLTTWSIFSRFRSLGEENLIYTVAASWKDLCNCTICTFGLVITGVIKGALVYLDLIQESSLPSITVRSKCWGIMLDPREGVNRVKGN